MPALRKRPEEMRAKAITNAFRAALNNKDWEQTDLARLTGKAQSEVSRIINHPLSVKFDTILLFADKLGVNLLSEEFKLRR